MSRPTLRFLNRAHTCNYCQTVNGVVYSEPPKVRARILWVRCRCGRSHFVCFRCAARVGSASDGVKLIAECARGYYARNKERIAAEGGRGRP